VIERLERSRAVVDRAAGGDVPIYGLNSALGANTGAPLAADDQLQYQVRAVRARAVGVGPPLPEDRVRAAMAARVAGMAHGGSGVSATVFRALVDALNRGLYPHVPASARRCRHLPRMSHIALALMGEANPGSTAKRVAAMKRSGGRTSITCREDGAHQLECRDGRTRCWSFDLARLWPSTIIVVALSFELPRVSRLQAARRRGRRRDKPRRRLGFWKRSTAVSRREGARRVRIRCRSGYCASARRGARRTRQGRYS
jgi:histidine ammonia-lyase